LKSAIFICPYPKKKAASQRFRFEQYLDLLELDYEQHSFWSEWEWPRIYEDGGIRYKVLSTKKAFLRRFRLLFKIRHFDKVFIHREATPVGPPWFEWVVAKVFRKPIIYDFDDAIWLPNSSKANEKLVGKFKNHGKTAKICSWAQTVVVGNEFLAEYAREYCTDVRVIPTTVDTEGYHNPDLFRRSESITQSKNYTSETEGYKVLSIKYKESDNTSTVMDNDFDPEVSSGNKKLTTIGWTGTHSTLKQLVPLFPTLEEVYKQYPFRFLLIADQAPENMPDFVEFRKWNKETEIEDLMELDIGVMPLFDTEWERGKCGFKAIQYSALRKPALVSDVGVNKNIVLNGMSGFVMEEMSFSNKIYDNWKRTILELLKDRSLLAEMGISGRKQIRENFSVQSNKEKYSQLFF